MDCGPLNLAHFHERRAEKLLRRHNFDEALKAIKNSLLYLEDVRKTVRLNKSLEVLETQKWEYERKLQQIEQWKRQCERRKTKAIITGDEQVESTGGVVVPGEGVTTYNKNTKPNCETLIAPTAQQIAKSIDKTIRDFESMQKSTLLDKQKHQQLKATDGNFTGTFSLIQTIASETSTLTLPTLTSTVGGGQLPKCQQDQQQLNSEESGTETLLLGELDDDLPSLAPLELPSFDYSAFQNSALIAIPPYSKV